MNSGWRNVDTKDTKPEIREIRAHAVRSIGNTGQRKTQSERSSWPTRRRLPQLVHLTDHLERCYNWLWKLVCHSKHQKTKFRLQQKMSRFWDITIALISSILENALFVLVDIRRGRGQGMSDKITFEKFERRTSHGFLNKFHLYLNRIAPSTQVIALGI